MVGSEEDEDEDEDVEAEKEGLTVNGFFAITTTKSAKMLVSSSFAIGKHHVAVAGGRSSPRDLDDLPVCVNTGGTSVERPVVIRLANALCIPACIVLFLRGIRPKNALSGAGAAVR